MIRDYIKDAEYFEIYLDEELNRITRFESKLRNNEVDEDRVFAFKFKLVEIKLGVLIAKYSMGEPIDIIKEDYLSILNAYSEVWRPGTYTRNLEIISLGILLNVKEEMQEVILPLMIATDVKDWLYEYLIFGESNSSLLYSRPYSLLKELTNENDEKKIVLLEEYIKSKWYKGHSDCGWYEIHKNKQNLYHGYWSFEAGAIAKILKIDDRGLEKTKYYPYDMVHYEG